MRRFALVAVLLLATTALAGCYGDGRTEWAYDATQLDAAEAMGRTGAGVRIGVLDTGIDVGHPSLDHLANGDDSDGELLGFRDYIRDRSGPGEAYDDDGHGTHVIGIMSGRGSGFWDKLFRGGVDLKGGSPNVGLYVAKVCDDDGCPLSGIEDALQWMRQQNVHIVTMSLGGQRGPITLTDEIRDDIDALLDSGVVVIASAGNDGSNGNDVNAPADIQGVIAVGAITIDLEVWSGSNRGSNGGFNQCRTVPLGGQTGRCDPHKKPELVAPGVNILSSLNDGRYGFATGTSQAAPFVASVVALMLEGGPFPNDRADVDRIKQILADNARKVDGQTLPHDPAAGYGIVQAVDSIRDY